MYLIVSYLEHPYTTLDILSYHDIVDAIENNRVFYPKLLNLTDLNNIPTTARGKRTSPTQVKLHWFNCETNADIFLGEMTINWANQQDVLRSKPTEITWELDDGTIYYPTFTVI